MKGHTEDGNFHPHQDKPGIHSGSVDNNSHVDSPGVKSNGKKLKIEEPEEKEYYSDRLDKVLEEVENETVEYGSDLVLSSGMDRQGMGYLAPIIEWIGWDATLEYENTDWESIYKEDGERGLMEELTKIDKSMHESALFRLDQVFGYDEPTENDRPKNEGERIAKQLLEGFEKMKDDELASYEHRERDYARSKKIISDIYEKQQTLIHNKLPRK
jgi:hypothetical protein